MCDSHEPQTVGLYFESSAELVVAALGVWKAGGAYLPVDPAYPAERANFILSDAGAPIVLASRAHAPSLDSGPWKTIFIEDIRADDAALRSRLPEAQPDDLAYVIYTSGSTGQPKGVEITHSNLRNLVEWHNREFSITSPRINPQQAWKAANSVMKRVTPARRHLCGKASARNANYVGNIYQRDRAADQSFRRPDFSCGDGTRQRGTARLARP